MNFKAALKVPWVNSYIKLHCYLTKGFEGGVGDPPLLNRVLLGGSFQTRNFKFRWNEPNKGINQSNFKDPLKLIGLIPLLNYTVI